MSSIQTPHPSVKSLLKATVVAIIVGGLILVTTVLPAEYSIDPTGIGAKLGLTKLGEATAETPTDVSNVAEEKKPTAEVKPAEGQLDAVGQPLKPVDDTAVTKQQGDYHEETMTVTLAPGKGAEIKAHMNGGESFVFTWTVAGGEVASDMHGDKIDAKNDEYTSYWIDGAMAKASGSFVAPFDGKHGWYWLNRGDKPVTVTVKVSGFYKDLFHP